jgi:membrane-bound ClpP family serine protease
MTPAALGLFSFFETIGTLSAILFIVGLLLLTAEMFMPGFGIAGITGLVLLIVAILVTAENVTEALIMTAILIVMVTLVLLFLLRSAKKGTISHRLILWSAARKEQGYSAIGDNSNLLGRDGVALTVLRPAGFGDFAGQRLDVVTEGSFIPAGTKIRIIRVEGRRIIVVPANTDRLTGQS